MKETYGSLLHDRWIFNGTHYIRVYASHNNTVPSLLRSETLESTTTNLNLVVVAPMNQVPDDDVHTTGVPLDEITNLNSKAYTQAFKEIIGYFWQQVSNWCKYLITYNSSTCFRIDRLVVMLHVGCNSHKLNLEVNRMVETLAEQDATIKSVHETMKAFKTRINHSSVLRNVTDPMPVMHSDTRCTVEVAMLKSFM